MEQSLPQDLIEEEILSRVLVKSLLRFRCVSKSWCSLISSKRFAESHLKKSLTNTNFTDQAIISTYMKAKYQNGYGDEFSVIDPSNELFGNGEEFSVSEYNYFEIVGCSNGLCCIMINRGEFVLYNPCTRKSNPLPLLWPGVHRDDYWNETYGFGFDEVNNDYKVFVIISNRDKNDKLLEYVAKIYSLKGSYSWKIIEGIGKYGEILPSNGKLVEGRLHWGVRNYDCGTWEIMFFDLRSEVVGVLEIPSAIAVESLHQQVDVLKGCLCVKGYCCKHKCCIYVWIMKEYGVKDSWYKVVTISYEQGPHNDSTTSITALGMTRARQIIPMCITQHLEILCYNNKSMFTFYDPKTQTHRQPQLKKLMTDVEIRIQSLISPFPH